MKRIFIMLAAIGIAGCSNPEQNGSVGNRSAETAEPVKVMSENASATEAEIEEVDAASGATYTESAPSFNGIFILPPQKQATVSVTMGGIVKSTSLLVGQYVNKDDVIAVLDNPEFIDLQQSYLDASAQLEYMEKEYARQSNLVSQEAASQKKYQQTKAEYLSVKSKVEAMSSKLSLLGVDPERLKQQGLMTRLEVKAPLGGYVTDTDINIGKYLNPGDPICDIIDNRELLLQLTAYEKDLQKIEMGDTVEFQVNGMDMRTFEAVIFSIDQKVDNNNRSIKVFARLEDRTAFFRPGMYVSARIKENI